jgi:hypothetical protein
MAPQDAISTPIFDQLLREMTEGTRPAGPTAEQHDSEQTSSPAPRGQYQSEWLGQGSE